jgi:hypothetical protein
MYDRIIIENLRSMMQLVINSGEDRKLKEYSHRLPGHNSRRYGRRKNSKNG